MEDAALCLRLSVTVLLLTVPPQSSLYVQKADAAFPRIDPNRLQFFEYESISVSCAGFKGSSEWKVMKKSPSNTTQWATSSDFLRITPAFATNSGEYWCENAEGERSSTLNISVTAADVILESPVLPVMERQTVALRCRKKAATSSLADFYKDGHYSQTGYQGQIIIHNVSKSDEGLYKCKISGGGSAESWLAVRAYVADAPQDGQESFTRPPYDGHVELSILLPTVFTIMCVAVLLSVVGILQCRKHKVACFSAEMPTTGSDPDKYKIVCEHAPIAEPRMDLYANITEHRNKRVRGRPRVAETHMPIDVNITGHKKKKTCRKANSSDQNETFCIDKCSSFKQSQREEAERSLSAETPD